MFPGSPARVHPSWPLVSLLPLADAGGVLGVWLRGCRRPLGVRCGWPPGPRHLLVSDDLGYLIRRCSRVAVRDGGEVRVVSASVLVGCRVLEIVLATPYLPTPHQLRRLFPAARVCEGVVALPLGLGSPEEALALCAAEGLPVSETRIAYRGVSVDALPAESLG
jgi:hypothetical protein